MSYNNEQVIEYMQALSIDVLLDCNEDVRLTNVRILIVFSEKLAFSEIRLLPGCTFRLLGLGNSYYDLLFVGLFIGFV